MCRILSEELEAANQIKNSAVEAENHVKHGACSKSLMSRGNFLIRKSCFALLVLLFNIFCFKVVIAQTEISFEEYMKQVSSLMPQLNEYWENKDYPAAEKIAKEAISLFYSLSKDEQEMYNSIQGELYFGLVFCLSTQNKREAAIDAFEKAVNIYGFVNYLRANTDTNLDNIRDDARFIALMGNLREKGDFIYLLRQTEKYQSADTTGLPRFTYEPASTDNLKKVRDFFNLDSIAGQGDEISKIKNLLKWVQTNIRHDGSNHAPQVARNSIDIYSYHKSTGVGVNCRLLAITLNELYLAMGFKSRFVTGMSKDESDAHVINSVYSNTLDKWLWMDPTFNAYWKDENDNLLCIEEVRERVIEDRPLILNDDANWNNQNKQTKETYLDGFMAKYLYWFTRVADSRFNPERSNENQTYIALCPVGFEPSQSNVEYVITNDATYFWEH